MAGKSDTEQWDVDGITETRIPYVFKETNIHYITDV